MPYKHGVTGSSPVVPTISFGPVVQSVSTPACHAGGRRFESVPGRHICHASSRAEALLNMPLQLSRQSSGLKIRVSLVRFRPEAPEMRVQLIRQSATLPRWRQRVRASSPAPTKKIGTPYCVPSFIIKEWYRGQVVRQRSAKPSFPSSNLGGTSKQKSICSADALLFVYLKTTR